MPRSNWTAAQTGPEGGPSTNKRKGDPWTVLVSKHFPDSSPSGDNESEIRAIRGNYWVDLD